MLKIFLSKRFKNGFTLTELLIVIALLIILITILIGILNPIALVGKAKDAERKRDLDAIKKTFEEYYNDNEVYPLDVHEWNIKSNCEKNLVDNFKYLYPWPCDPDGEPYLILISDEGDSFRVLVDLENKSDVVIPDGWYDDEFYKVEGYSVDDINYGVSSSNVLWYEYSLDDDCDLTGCFKKPLRGGCNSTQNDEGCKSSDPSNDGCYHHGSCKSYCEVFCCGPGCN